MLVANEYFLNISFRNAAIVAQGSCRNEIAPLLDSIGARDFNMHLTKLSGYAQSLGIGVSLNLEDLARNATILPIEVGTAENTQLLLQKLIDVKMLQVAVYEKVMKDGLLSEYPDSESVLSQILLDERDDKLKLEDALLQITNLSLPVPELASEKTDYSDEKYMIPVEGGEDERIFDSTGEQLHESSGSFVVRGLMEMFG